MAEYMLRKKSSTTLACHDRPNFTTSPVICQSKQQHKIDLDQCVFGCAKGELADGSSKACGAKGV